MAAPTNVSAATAIDLGAFPATYTQNVNDGGTTYEVWTKFTSTQDGVVGLFASGVIGGGGSSYIAKLNTWIGPASSPVFYPDNQGTANNVPAELPVTDGVTYYIQIQSLNGNVASADLTILAEYFAQESTAVGMLCIPDDTDGYPMAILSQSTGVVKHFVLGFPGGEQGVSEPSIGAVMVDDNTALKFKLYTPALTFVAELAHPNAIGTIGQADLYISFGRTTQTFYVGWISSGTTMALRRVSPTDFSILHSWTIAGVSNVRAFAPNVDETLLYLSGKAGTTGSAISKYDLVGETFLANFSATIANYVSDDILVLSDGTVVVSYFKGTAGGSPHDLIVKTYDSSGSVLQSKSYGSDVQNVTPSRMTYALDDPNSFWMYHKRDGGLTTFSTIHNIKASDLSDIAPTPFDRIDFEFGVSEGEQVADPQRYGASESCPIFVLRGTVPPTTQTFTIRRQRRALLPSSADDNRMKIPILDLLLQGGVGLTPDAWNSTANLPLGANPEVRLRISKDGGKTWSPERSVSAGLIGQYRTRARWLQATGQYRNAVVELTVDDPVDWQFLSLFGDPEEGVN